MISRQSSRQRHRSSPQYCTRSVPKQGMLSSATWMDRMRSTFFILDDFIPSSFAFSLMSAIFICVTSLFSLCLRCVSYVQNTQMDGSNCSPPWHQRLELHIRRKSDAIIHHGYPLKEQPAATLVGSYLSMASKTSFFQSIQLLLP